MHVFAAATRAGDIALFIFGKAENDFEGLLAIFAEEFIARHDNPQPKIHTVILRPLGSQHAASTQGSRKRNVKLFTRPSAFDLVQAHRMVSE